MIMKNKRILLLLNKLAEKRTRLELDLETILFDESSGFTLFDKKINKVLKKINAIDYKIKLIEHYVILKKENDE